MLRHQASEAGDGYAIMLKQQIVNMAFNANHAVKLNNFGARTGISRKAKLRLMGAAWLCARVVKLNWYIKPEV